MFRLTREVRFAVAPDEVDAAPEASANGFAGVPPLTGLGYFFCIQATVAGDLDPASNYLLNIREIDGVIRRSAVPLFRRAIDQRRFGGGASVLVELFERVRHAWPGRSLECLRLWLSPFLSLAVNTGELPMVRLSQRFEFSASHRLHNPALSESANCQTFGKCSNPHGHGHNYILEVTLGGNPDAAGLVIPVPTFERIVSETVINRFDHKNLNVELPQFRELIPTVENIAMVIYRLLKPQFDAIKVKLAAVTVWETPKTWCEYSE
jgi:6-pyruvoyltetrahydropterin/6-carboxytetrahydropterin synthase